ncbi:MULTISPECIES: hypothetical protein [unclassified Novosphingobium]|uniref:hypothetical protein n=1 Tax=unclassified Novosphingobium TaxID=2644732 RepID=UPI001469F8AF|nr:MULTISPECIES: hypothetical protein [unclassified Novosphingobium]NMN03485.1 hypothetical protein [Novosphingobium sp. SG919]NMN86525.1 hypothetical protein [Novosphingobium sp. SG916]
MTGAKAQTRKPPPATAGAFFVLDGTRDDHPARAAAMPFLQKMVRIRVLGAFTEPQMYCPFRKGLPSKQRFSANAINFCITPLHGSEVLPIFITSGRRSPHGPV